MAKVTSEVLKLRIAGIGKLERKNNNYPLRDGSALLDGFGNNRGLTNSV